MNSIVIRDEILKHVDFNVHGLHAHTCTIHNYVSVISIFSSSQTTIELFYKLVQ